MLLDLWLKKLHLKRRNNRKVRLRDQPVQMEALEDRVLLVAQILTTAPTGDIEVAASSTTTFDVIYDTSPTGDLSTGLALQLHYNSAEVDFGGDIGDEPTGITDIFQSGFSAIQISADTDDDDGDANTDRFINMLWFDLSGNFPPGVTPPITIFTANPTTTAAFDGSQLNFFSDSANDTLTADPVVLTEVLPDPILTITGPAAVTEGGDLVFDVSLDRAPSAGEDVTVTVATTDDTATAGSDYTARSETLTFAAGGATMQQVTVSTINDAVPENAEDLQVLLSNAVNATIGTASATGTINDDGDVPTVSIMPVTADEGGEFSFIVSVSDSPIADLTVDVTTTNGTAEAGTDFTALNTTLTFTPGGPTEIAVVVDVTDDADIEGAEDFTVALSNVQGGMLGVASVTGTITDNDGNGTISGQKYHDRNLNGVQEPGEEFLAGWTIQLLDATGTVIDTATTGDVDIDGDGTAEAGAYQFTSVLPGDYSVEEVLQAGWRQSAPVTAEAQAAFNLDQQYSFISSNNYFDSWGGLGERWILSESDGWFFLLPDGSLNQWDNSPATALTGTEVGNVGAAIFDDPSLLTDAQEPNGHALTLVGSMDVVDIDFGNYQLGVISGTKFNDEDADGAQGPGEGVLQGWTIELTDASGNLIDSAVTDVDGNYAFTDLLPGTYGIREVQQDGWTQTLPGTAGSDASTRELYDLDQANNFRLTESQFQDWGGLNEKWIQSDSGWHYITPDGSLYDWDMGDRSNLSGDLVATLDSSVYDDPSLLASAIAPGSAMLQVASGDVIDQDFGNTDGPVVGVDGDLDCSNVSGDGDLTVMVDGGDLIINGDDGNNAVMVYVDDNGMVSVAGLGGTTINGASDVFTTTLSDGFISENLYFHSGDGDDILCLHEVTIGHNLEVDTGAGNDGVFAENVRINNHMDIDTEAGSDAIWLGNVLVVQRTVIQTGDGNDNFASIASHHKEGANLHTGAGDDQVFADAVRFGSNLLLDLGDGEDGVAALGSFVNGAEALIEGDDGFDLAFVDGNTSFRGDVNVTGMEGELSDAEIADRIDAAMQLLADMGIEAPLSSGGQIAPTDNRYAGFGDN